MLAIYWKYSPVKLGSIFVLSASANNALVTLKWNLNYQLSYYFIKQLTCENVPLLPDRQA